MYIQYEHSASRFLSTNYHLPKLTYPVYRSPTGVDKKPSNYNRRRVDWVCVLTRQCSNYYNNYAINLHRKVYAGEKNQMLPRCRRPRVPWLACRKKVTKCREFFRIHIFYSYSPHKPSQSLSHSTHAEVYKDYSFILTRKLFYTRTRALVFRFIHKLHLKRHLAISLPLLGAETTLCSNLFSLISM